VPKSRNLVLLHGLIADGSGWSEIIARLQAKGINATLVQNPSTTFDESGPTRAGCLLCRTVRPCLWDIRFQE
jgi:hypothetical protein